MKIISSILFFLFFFSLFWLFGHFILGNITYPYNVLVFIAMICSIIYLYRKDKDGLVRLFKDIHQSNLDDIAEHQTEGQIENMEVKMDILDSSKKIIKNFSSLVLVATLIWFIILIFGKTEFGDGSYIELLLAIPGVLIIAFIIVKSFSIINKYFNSNDDEIGFIEKEELN